MTVRHYTGFWLKHAITTAACIATLLTTLSACKDSDSGQPEAPEGPTKIPTQDSIQDSLGAVMENLNEQLDQASSHVQQVVAPHAEEIQARTKDEVEKAFRWEYKVQDIPADTSAEAFEAKLTELGDEGWECVSFQPVHDGTRVTCKRKPRGALAYLKFIPGF